jgi:acetolactate synthase-1/2/3 large subunit
MLNAQANSFIYRQNLFYEDRYSHTHQQNPDFVPLARSMRVAAERVSRTSDVEAKLKWLIEQEGPALLEVITDRKVPVLPMVPSGRGLHEFLVYDEGEHIHPNTKRGAPKLTL